MTGAAQPRESPRKRLLDAADELFYTQGIAATGVDAVIARAGVATASLYRNFGGKDDLVAAYLEERDRRWREHWQACVAEQHDPVERVLALYGAVRGWGTGADHGCAHVAASLQLPADHPGRAVARQHKQYVAARLQQLVTDADLPDAADLTQDLVLVYEGMFTLLALDLDPDPVGRAYRLARQLVSPCCRRAR